MPELSFEDYKNNCVAELLPLQDEFMKLYDINSYEEWYYDHDIGAFHSKSHSGKTCTLNTLMLALFQQIPIPGNGPGIMKLPLPVCANHLKK